MLLTWASLIGQFVHLVRGEGDGVKMVDVEDILARYKFHFIRVHDNMVLVPIENKFNTIKE